MLTTLNNRLLTIYPAAKRVIALPRRVPGNLAMRVTVAVARTGVCGAAAERWRSLAGCDCHHGMHRTLKVFEALLQRSSCLLAFFLSVSKSDNNLIRDLSGGIEGRGMNNTWIGLAGWFYWTGNRVVWFFVLFTFI